MLAPNERENLLAGVQKYLAPAAIPKPVVLTSSAPVAPVFVVPDWKVNRSEERRVGKECA